MAIDWDHVHLLAWYGRDGKPYLSSWAGDRPYVHVVVTGTSGGRMPLWKAPVPPGIQMHPIPPEIVTREEQLAYAAKLDGFLALGWYFAEGGIKREILKDPIFG